MYKMSSEVKRLTKKRIAAETNSKIETHKYAYTESLLIKIMSYG